MRVFSFCLPLLVGAALAADPPAASGAGAAGDSATPLTSVAGLKRVADAIHVEFDYRSAAIALCVKDNGTGFDPAEHLQFPAGCLGVLNIA